MQNKSCFLTTNGPKAVGPYSTAVVAGGMAYLSGMVPLVPETGKKVEGGIEAQTERVIANIAIVLGEMGLAMGDVVKTCVYLTDMADFAAVNAIYREHFGPEFPARTCVQVARLPLDVNIEIEVVAIAK